MSQWPFPVVDCDGHLVESIPELTEFMDSNMRQAVLNAGRQREGAFPSLDGFHGPRIRGAGPTNGEERPYVTASSHRKGSAEDYMAFLDKAGVDEAVIFTSEGLSVGFIQNSDYAVGICRAYNDYVYDRYARVSDKLHPMALIALQDPKQARLELRRAVKDLGFPGAMIPSTGLSLHVAHEYYWPIYEEAADLDCVLGVHGGSIAGIGMDTFTARRAISGTHHSIALLLSLTALIGHGVMERFPTLRVGFFEGGCSWLVMLLDRMERHERVTGRIDVGTLTECLASERILIGCEGNDGSLPHLMERIGPNVFSWASDYPHEVDLEAAKEMIRDTVGSKDFSDTQKAAVLGTNAQRFFRLKPKENQRAKANSGGEVAHA
ncbi:MAG: amidohydrolase family protein [Deltaproteobacteria bacterium]|nr:amidohydrolase family protein [Deltaproteobacteria bacterium]